MTKNMLIGAICLFVGAGLMYNLKKPDMNSDEFWQGAPNYTQRVSEPWPHPTPALYASPAGRRQGPTLPRPPEIASQRKEHFPPRPPQYANRRFVEQTAPGATAKDLEQIASEFDKKLVIQ